MAMWRLFEEIWYSKVGTERSSHSTWHLHCSLFRWPAGLFVPSKFTGVICCVRPVDGKLCGILGIRLVLSHWVKDCYFPLGLVLLALLVVVVHGHAFLIGKNMGMLARIAATAAIYQKVGARWLVAPTRSEGGRDGREGRMGGRDGREGEREGGRDGRDGWREGGRDGREGWEGGREGWEGGREGGGWREGWEGGMEGGGKEGGRAGDGGRKGGREGGEWREGGWGVEGGKEGDGGREGGRGEGGR